MVVGRVNDDNDDDETACFLRSKDDAIFASSFSAIDRVKWLKLISIGAKC